MKRLAQDSKMKASSKMILAWEEVGVFGEKESWKRMRRWRREMRLGCDLTVSCGSDVC